MACCDGSSHHASGFWSPLSSVIPVAKCHAVYPPWWPEYLLCDTGTRRGCCLLRIACINRLDQYRVSLSREDAGITKLICVAATSHALQPRGSTSKANRNEHIVVVLSKLFPTVCLATAMSRARVRKRGRKTDKKPVYDKRCNLV